MIIYIFIAFSNFEQSLIFNSVKIEHCLFILYIFFIIKILKKCVFNYYRLNSD